MYELAFIAAFAIAAFLVAWVVNGLVGMMSGENPRDTGRLGSEVFLRLFAVLEFGFVGRILNYVGLTGWPRKFVLFVGLLCVLSFLVRACHNADDVRYHNVYSVTNGQLHEIKKRQ